LLDTGLKKFGTGAESENVTPASSDVGYITCNSK